MLYSSKANVSALSSWLAVLGQRHIHPEWDFLWITPLRRLDCGIVVWLGLSPSGRTCLSCGFSSQPPCNTQPALCKVVTFGMISIWLDLFWNTGWQKGFPLYAADYIAPSSNLGWEIRRCSCKTASTCLRLQQKINHAGNRKHKTLLTGAREAKQNASH